MIPTHDPLISIIPEDLLPIAQAIAAALSGNEGDLLSYDALPLSSSGNLPATHRAAKTPCDDDFAGKAFYFKTHPVELHAALQGLLTQTQCNDYCARSQLFLDVDLAEVLNAAGLKRIEDFQ